MKYSVESFVDVDKSKEFEILKNFDVFRNKMFYPRNISRNFLGTYNH